MTHAILASEAPVKAAEGYDVLRYVLLVKRSKGVEAMQSQEYRELVAKLRESEIPDVQTMGHFLGSLPSERGHRVMSIVFDTLTQYYS